MGQKTKMIMLAAVIVIVVMIGVYFFKKNKSIKQQSLPKVTSSHGSVQSGNFATSASSDSAKQVQSQAQQPQTQLQVQPQPKPQPQPQSQPQQKSAIVVEGKVVSIGEKQINIKLSGDKNGTVNINPSVPVRVTGGSQTGNLSLVKIDDTVSVNTDDSNNALEILIKR